MAEHHKTSVATNLALELEEPDAATPNDLCNIEPGDMGENVKQTRITVALFWTEFGLKTKIICDPPSRNRSSSTKYQF